MMKRMLALLLAAALTAAAAGTIAEETPAGLPEGTPPHMQEGQPPEKPQGDPPDGMGTPPDGMGTPPDGTGTPPGGMGTPPGGMSAQPETYEALYSFADGGLIEGDTVSSTGADENAVLVTGGEVTVADSTVSRVSDSSTGGDSASFYGVGAALLVTDGTLNVANSVITTDANGGTGVFAYGSGTARVSDTTIITQQSASGGLHVAGGGTLAAENCIVETSGGSSAAIRSDRGSGTMTVSGGSYTSHGSGSPAVYVTADISIENAELTATGAEALCLEGLNTVRLYHCVLSGDMPEDSRNDNTWTVILYQSMSGDSQLGEGSFLMDGGTLKSAAGGLFYTTNTASRFTLRDVTIETAEDCPYFLRVTGNSNQRGWGAAGSNGADCVFTAIRQEMNGDILYDSFSSLTLYLTEGSVLTGAVLDDESCAGQGGTGTASLIIDSSSAWIVTADSTLGSLCCAGTITDAEGRTVTVVGQDGTVFVQGESDVTVTAASWSTETDVSGAGTVDTFAEHAI